MNRNTCFVKVENIANGVSQKEIVALFSKLIGDVRKSEQKYQEDGASYLELSFNTYDAAKKALCMSGYNISGVPLSVTALPVSDLPHQTKIPDMRRNLYVLGLPSELAKNELVSEFSRYGKVAHCVILATVDNASRRRGFVVMSSHEEAKLAMEGLSRTDLKGHVIDVSWAVVQRSRGFLDGGDRAMVLEPRSDPAPATTDTPQGLLISVKTSFETSAAFKTFNVNASSPTAKLLVMNLPTLLFSGTSDLDPLLCPFGSISTTEFKMDPASGGKSSSVIVEFDSVAGAQEAREHLHGQVYAGFALKLEYLRSGNISPPLDQESSPTWLPTRDNTPLASAGNKNLNPLATPFIHEQQDRLSASSSYSAVSRPSQGRVPGVSAVAPVQYLDMDTYSPHQHYYQYTSHVVPPQTLLCYGPSYNHALHGRVDPNQRVLSASPKWNANAFAQPAWIHATATRQPLVNSSYSNVYA